MALSYTDSYKYGLYIVTLAHQVISDWFTRCRLTFRKGFVTLIAKALKSGLLNIEQNKAEHNSDDDVKKFHEDMSDVCLDMMARYSFSTHLSEPKRSPMVEFLLSKGISHTWLAGNMLVTVTTSSTNTEDCACSLIKCNEPKNDQETATTVKEDVKNPSNNSENPPEVVEEEIGTDTPKDNFSKQSNVCSEIENYSESFITASSEILDDGVSCEEEGYEPTPLVAKLTQHLVEPTSASSHVFSPSEQLLFSRQASKVLMSDNFDDEDDDDSSDSEYYAEDIFDLKQDVTEEQVDGNDEIGTHSLKASTSTDATNKTPAEVKKPPVIETSKVFPTKKTNEPFEHYKRNYVEKSYELPKSRCQCSCSGWAEIYIRRPTGNTSWVMKLENKEKFSKTPLFELSLLASSLNTSKIKKKLCK